MTLHCIIDRAHALTPVLTLALLSSGCIAEPKSVGETGSESDSESDSDSNATASESDTSQMTGTGGQTDSDTGPSAQCSDFADETTCVPDPDNIDRPCEWVEVQTVDHSPDTCGFLNEPQGRCVERFYAGESGCVAYSCGENDGSGYFFREVDSNTAEVFFSPSCDGTSYPGYQGCNVADPERQCLCMCESGPPALPPGYWEEISDQGGCGDMMVHAKNPNDSVGMILWLDEGLVDQVMTSGEPLDVQYDAPDFDRFELRVGTNVTHQACNDAIFEETVIDVQWEPVSGTVDIHLEPGDPYPTATVTLTDIELEVTQGGAAPATIPTYTFDQVGVGWLPG